MESDIRAARARWRKDFYNSTLMRLGQWNAILNSFVQLGIYTLDDKESDSQSAPCAEHNLLVWHWLEKQGLLAPLRKALQAESRKPPRIWDPDKPFAYPDGTEGKGDYRPALPSEMNDPQVVTGCVTFAYCEKLLRFLQKERPIDFVG